MDPRQRLADSSARMLRGCYFLGQNLEHSRALTYNRCQLCIGFSGIHPTAGSGALGHESAVVGSAIVGSTPFFPW
jgi:hypothetical protein